MIKKLKIKQKSKNILETSSLLLFYHLNPFSTKEWHFLKGEVKKRAVSYLFLQDKIFSTVEKSVLKKKDLSKINKLIAGPTFLLASSSLKDILSSHSSFSKNKNIIFLGGIYDNYPLSAKQLEKILSRQKEGMAIVREEPIIQGIQGILGKKSEVLFFKNIYQLLFSQFTLIIKKKILST